jgi:hypothetical protein
VQLDILDWYLLSVIILVHGNMVKLLRGRRGAGGYSVRDFLKRKEYKGVRAGFDACFLKKLLQLKKEPLKQIPRASFLLCCSSTQHEPTAICNVESTRSLDHGS